VVGGWSSQRQVSEVFRTEAWCQRLRIPKPFFKAWIRQISNAWKELFDQHGTALSQGLTDWVKSATVGLFAEITKEIASLFFEKSGVKQAFLTIPSTYNILCWQFLEAHYIAVVAEKSLGVISRALEPQIVVRKRFEWPKMKLIDTTVRKNILLPVREGCPLFDRRSTMMTSLSFAYLAASLKAGQRSQFILPNWGSLKIVSPSLLRIGLIRRRILVLIECFGYPTLIQRELNGVMAEMSALWMTQVELNVMESLRKTRSFHREEERMGVASNDSSSVRMDYP
jgi:hypothetical protein